MEEESKPELEQEEQEESESEKIETSKEIKKHLQKKEG